MRSFIKAFKDKIKFTYPRCIGQDIRLGYYGIMTDDGFQYIGKLNLPFGTTKEKLTDKLTFDKDVTVNLIGEADVNLYNVIGTGFKIGFTKADSYYFSSYICTNERIDDPRSSLEQGLINLLNSRKKSWNEDWVIITALKKSKNTIWIYSKNRATDVIVNCDAKGLTTLANTINLEKAKFSFIANTSSSELTTFATDNDDESIIGFELMKLRKEQLVPRFRGEGSKVFSEGHESWKLVRYDD